MANGKNAKVRQQIDSTLSLTLPPPPSPRLHPATASPFIYPPAVQFDLYRLEWAPAPTGSEYKGCYKDVKDDRLMDDLMRLDNLTPDLCREHCMGKGVKTYATQVKTNVATHTSRSKTYY